MGFSSSMYALREALFRSKNVVGFAENSLRAGKNNFYVKGKLHIANVDAANMGHGYVIEVSSKGYGHLTSLRHVYDSVWRGPLRGKDGVPVIEWEHDYDRMVREVDDIRKVVKGVCDSMGAWSMVNAEVSVHNEGLPYSRFDDREPAGFIS